MCSFHHMGYVNFIFENSKRTCGTYIYFCPASSLYIIYIYNTHTRAHNLSSQMPLSPLLRSKKSNHFLIWIYSPNKYIYIFPECDCNFSQGPFKVRELITKHWCKIHAHGPFWNEIYLINQSLADKLKNPSTSLCVSLYLKRPT